MGLLWLLVVTCLACTLENLHAGSSDKRIPESSNESTLLMSSLFGFRPCIDEDCSNLPLKDAADSIEEDHKHEDISRSGYTPEHPQIPSQSPDTTVEYCLPLHTETLRDISLIEKHHPDIINVKQKVIEDLVRYVAESSIVNSENCNPARKLLDFIFLAAYALRQDYYTKYEVECNYTKISCGDYEEPSGQTEDPPTTTKCVYNQGSETPGYVSTEPSSKAPPTTTNCVDNKGSETPGYVSTEPSSTAPPTTKCVDNQGSEKPGSVSTEPSYDATVTPCPEASEKTEEIIAEEYSDSPFVGSVRGIPGVHYPNYTEVPVTSFSCADKKYTPGFYADLETGCQVFHVCYEHRRESFLCPVGTIFNQPILACDYWYSSNCSLAVAYYEINDKSEEVDEEEEMNVAVDELISVLVDSKKEEPAGEVIKEQSPQVDIMKFLPVKAKVTEFSRPVSEVSGVSISTPKTLDVDEVASQIFHNMVFSATNVVSKTRGVVGMIPEPGLLSGAKGKLTIAAGTAIKPVVAKAKLSAAASIPAAKVAAKAAIPVVAKAKLAAAVSVPVTKMTAAKAALPVIAKAKLAKAAASASISAAKMAAAKAAVPIAVKTKFATLPLKAAASVSIPGAKIAAMKKKLAGATLKSAVPVVANAKFVAAVPKVAIKSSVPVFKAKVAASAIPASKMFALKAASAPIVKAKVALPLVKSAISGPVKAKLGAVAAISPLTKKALALGYMKLLKAKKLALVG